VGDDEIVAALEPMVDDAGGLAGDVEQKARILAAELFVEADQDIAERKVEDARHDQDRSAERHPGGIID